MTGEAVYPSKLIEYETGTSRPSPTMFRAIVQFYGIPRVALLAFYGMTDASCECPTCGQQAVLPKVIE
jgi:hypothetical protein